MSAQCFIRTAEDKKKTTELCFTCVCSQSYLQNVPLPYLKSIEEGYKKTFLPKIRYDCYICC